VILGLSLPWAMLALPIGNIFGAVFMAGHSAQGPKLGIPQMIQSRAQFGFYGDPAAGARAAHVPRLLR
jgi:nucleobase:cation symporter-1, NCS1 family